MTDTIINSEPSPGINLSPIEQMAFAWVNRWVALGGSFGWTHYPDGSKRTLGRSLPMPYVWEPPSWEEAKVQSPKLEPFHMITEREQHEGASKMLESFLVLVPGLSDEVRKVGAIIADSHLSEGNV